MTFPVMKAFLRPFPRLGALEDPHPPAMAANV